MRHGHHRPPRIGSLCTGYGGLDLAVLAVLGGHLAWYADNDPAAAGLLARRWPGVPNLGDITTVDWHQVPRVDVLACGWPCQDISHAGTRRGIAGPRSRLWYHVADAVGHLRPGLVFLENVAGLRTRGLEVVLADLAAMRYDTAWVCLRASEVGAAHRRDRIFLLYLDDRASLWPTSQIGLGLPAMVRWRGRRRRPSGCVRLNPDRVVPAVPAPSQRAGCRSRCRS